MDMNLRVVLQEILQERNPSWKSLSACNEDKMLTVQCIFLHVAKNCLLTPDLYPWAYLCKIYISVMFYDYFC